MWEPGRRSKWSGISPAGVRSRTRARRALATIGALAFALACGCGGGGKSEPQRNPPLVWDQAQATWDNVNWQ